MEKRIFYRIANTETNQGLWYDYEGNFTGLIHTKFNFCTNNELPMPYDEDIIGWLSATDTLENLWFWFTKEDISQLEEHGYFITIFEATEYKFHDNHWAIGQKTSKVIAKMLINDLCDISLLKDDVCE